MTSPNPITGKKTGVHKTVTVFVKKNGFNIPIIDDKSISFTLCATKLTRRRRVSVLVS